MNLPFRKPPARIVIEADKLAAVKSDMELALMLIASGRAAIAFDVLVVGYGLLAGEDAALDLRRRAHRDGIAIVGRAA
jgi:hypothetical protein